MQLDQVTAEIRPRTAEEAVDLGLALTRQHFARIAGLWSLSVLPLCALILGLCFWSPLFGACVIVWIKPIFGRVPLMVLSL